MKDSTIKVCEYLCTREAKTRFEKLLAYYCAGEDMSEPIASRFSAWALEEVANDVVEFDSQGFMSEDLEVFEYQRSDGTYWSEIPWLVRRLKKTETMLKHFGEIFDKWLP